MRCTFCTLPVANAAGAAIIETAEINPQNIINVLNIFFFQLIEMLPSLHPVLKNPAVAKGKTTAGTLRFI
jgi:hypothetical protein